MDYLKSKKPYVLIVILLISIAIFDNVVWGEKTKPVRVELKADSEAWFDGNETVMNLKLFKKDEDKQ